MGNGKGLTRAEVLERLRESWELASYDGEMMSAERAELVSVNLRIAEAYVNLAGRAQYEPEKCLVGFKQESGNVLYVDVSTLKRIEQKGDRSVLHFGFNPKTGEGSMIACVEESTESVIEKLRPYVKIANVEIEGFNGSNTGEKQEAGV